MPNASDFSRGCYVTNLNRISFRVNKALLGEWALRTCKGLESLSFIRHISFKPFGRGATLLSGLIKHCLELLITYKSQDDDSSRGWFIGVGDLLMKNPLILEELF